MFVYYYLHVHAPFPALAPLLEAPERLLGTGPGGLFQVRLGTDQALSVGTTFLLSAGQAHRASDRVVLPVTVTAEGAAIAFPTLEGELAFAPIGHHVTQLSLTGSYQMPRTTATDPVAARHLHHLVEAAVKHLADHLGGRASGKAPLL